LHASDTKRRVHVQQDATPTSHHFEEQDRAHLSTVQYTCNGLLTCISGA
jgi:hypothetical protein